MLVVEIQDPGPSGHLAPGARPIPVPGPDEVLIEVHAAGVNRPDVLQRHGLYPPPPGESDLPGLEIAGVVRQRGADVTEWSVGDRVMALIAGGGYAEYATAPAGQCLSMPEALSFEEAAALPEGLFTIFANVFELGQLQSGRCLLVHGGSSGIGTLTLCMAKLAGARTITTSRSEAKRSACRDLGADRAVLSTAEDFEAVVREETKGRGVDLVLDMVGAAFFEKNLACLAAGGRHVSIAFSTGKHVGLDLFAVMRRQLTLTGSTLRARSREEKRRLRDALRARFGADLEAGRIRPVLAEVFPLEQAGRAHEMLEANEVVGKLVLRPDAIGATD